MMGRTSRLSSGVLACTMAMAACGDGGGSNTPASPSPTGAVTITLTDVGVSPSRVEVVVGSVVQFVNNSTVTREVNSGPHPVHTDCPPVNEVGLLTPGQTGQTGPLTLSGACSFHDHLTDAAAPWAGVILVGTSDPEAAVPVY